LPDDPWPWMVIVQEKLAADRTGDDRVGDGEVRGTNGEVDVDGHQADQSDPCQPVQDVHESPGHVAEEIRIPGEEDRLHATEHEDSGDDRRQAGRDDGEVVELVLQRVLGELARWRGRSSECAQGPSPGILPIYLVGPDRPESEPER